MSKGKQIVKQVDFYFSDSNLPRDKFLTELVSKSEEGWCPIQTIADFQRMKKITTDVSEVVEALKTSDFLDVSEDGKDVKRKVPLGGEKADTLEQSVYVKGLLVEWTLDEVQSFVEGHLQEGEKLCFTRMRRFKGGEKDKQFKGSVFLEFNNTAAADRFAALTLKATTEGENLLLMKKAAYAAKKNEEHGEKKKAKKGGDGGEGEGEGEGPGDGAEDEDKGEEKKKKHQKKGGQKRKAEEPAKEDPEEFPKDMIISMTTLGEGCSREALKETIEGLGATVQYVEYARGGNVGYVRLSEKSTMLATACCEKLVADGVEIAGAKPTAKALAGEEEAEYWAKVAAGKKNK